MKQKNKFLIIAVSIIAIFFSSLIVASLNQYFLFSSDLRVEEIQHFNNDNSYSTTIFDGQTKVGTVYFRIDPSSADSSQNRMIFSFASYSQTELDSFTLRFSAGTKVISVYREASSYIWEHEFHVKDSVVMFEVLDVGVYGIGTITLDFILFPHDTNILSLDILLSMHNTSPLQLNSQKAQVLIDASIPEEFA